MNDNATLFVILRAVCLVFWLVPTAQYARPAWRVIRGRPKTCDDDRAAIFFTGLIMIGGCGRWLIAPGSSFAFAALYVLVALLAIYASAVAWVRR